MSKLNNNGLDDPLVMDSCPSFAGGQHSNGAPDRLSATEAAELLNIDIRDGTACTRRGTADVGSALPGPILGLARYGTPAQDLLMACVPGALHRWDGSAWGLLATSPLGAGGAPVCLAQLENYLYLADGLSPLHRWDGASLSSLGSGSAGNPPITSLILQAGNRLWMAGASAAPDTLYASKPLNGGSSGWDAALGVLRIGAGDGDPITALAEWDGNELIVFKRNSIYVVQADPAKTSGDSADKGLANAVVTKISDRLGCVSHRSVVRVGKDVWFLAASGIHTVGRVLAATQQEVKEAVSWPVQDLVQRITWPAAQQAAAILWDHRYLLSLPLDGAAAPNFVLVYHTQRQAWSGLWSGWQATAWAIAQQSEGQRLLFGRPDGVVRRWLDTVSAGNEVESTYQDGGANIPTRLASRALSLGEPLSEKSGLSVHAEFFGSQATAQVAVCLDEDEPQPLGPAFATSTGALVLPLLLPSQLPGAGVKRKAFGAQGLTSFRTLQIIVSSPAQKLSVRSVAATGFLNSLRLEE